MKARGIFVSLLVTLICVLMFLGGCSGGGGGSDNSTPLSSEKAITAYSINGIAGTIDESEKTISLIVPFGTDVTVLVATFTSTGKSINVGATAQSSGITANNLTTSVTYTVTAEDRSTANYIVTVTVAPSPYKAITAYSLKGIAGMIDETAKTIAVTLSFGDITALAATFTTTGAGVKVGVTEQVSGTTKNNFTSPVTYTVTAADSSSVSYTVTVNLAEPLGKLPRTGQTISYSTGDDGDLQKGISWPSPRFTSGTGSEADCITDNLTGLMWKRIVDPALTKTWQEALDYMATTTNGGALCGHTDWRLPNITELESLINAGPTDNITWLNSQGFYLFYSWYWSSTTYANDTNWARDVWPSDGALGRLNKPNTAPLFLPVRTAGAGVINLPRTGQTIIYSSTDDGDLQKGIAWPSPRFTDNKNGTVTDNLTGLVWLKNANCFNTQTQTDALNYANVLKDGACGLSDSSEVGNWRLPNRKELLSLINNSKTDNAAWLNTQEFNNVQTNSYWTSTTVAVDTTKAWFISADTGEIYAGTKANTAYVWPVRSRR